MTNRNPTSSKPARPTRGLLPAAATALLISSVPTAAFAQLLDATPRLAVISAFEPEWIALQEHLSDRQEHRVGEVRFLTGTMEGKDVVLFLSGVSMVNAAMTTQMAIDRFDMEGIVFSGIAGGVDPSLSIGDVIVPERWGQYLEGVLARETDDGTFEVPSFLQAAPFENYGMIFTREVGLPNADGEPERRFWFDVDPGMLETAHGIASVATLERCAADGQCLDDPQILVGGNGVSGSFFMDNAAFREHTFAAFEASVLDMESAAVAQVAAVNSVPFIAFRSLSDLAGGDGGEPNEMATFMGLASENAASVVRTFLREYEAD